MDVIRSAGLRICLAIALPCLAPGCRSTAQVPEAAAPEHPSLHATPSAPSLQPRPAPPPSPSDLGGTTPRSTNSHLTANASPPVATIAFEEDAGPPLPAPPVTELGDAEQLQLAPLIAEVLQRNPTLQAAAAAWQAASQRYPQVVALEDPVLQTMFGPGAWGDDDLDGGYTVGIAQKVPWKGKLALRGQIANWQTNAAKWDSVDVKLQLTEAAKLAYFDYYLVHRQLEVNSANTAILQEFREIAQARYETAQSPQQDMLQAEVELGNLARRQLELQQQKSVAIARINTLLHRPADVPLPLPPADLPTDGSIPELDQLQNIAVQQRPDLAAIASRIQSERSAAALACKEFYPDFELMARYDAFWQEKPLRPMVGVNLNVPLNQDKRHAAVNEALFKTSKLQAEYAQQVDAIQRDVQSSHARLVESEKAVALYDEKILPAAEINVESARAGYESGQIDFLRLVEAQRQLNELQEDRHETVAEYHSRVAELERVVGSDLSM